MNTWTDSKRMKKIFYSNENQKKAGVATLIRQNRLKDKDWNKTQKSSLYNNEEFDPTRYNIY